MASSKVEKPLELARLLELAERADKMDACVFTPFLTPPEAELAQAAARKARVAIELWGGFEQAERRMARFSSAYADEQPFPLEAVEIAWPKQAAPSHRDLLGSVMGLGVKRQCVGDIVLLPQKAFLFAERAVAETIASSLLEAGRVRLSVKLTQERPSLSQTAGEEVRDTVSSVRLDAVVAGGFSLSRTQAAELIAAGAVKLRHQPTLRADARLDAGDAVSVRGYGRLLLHEIGTPNRKGRLPVRLERWK